MPNNPFDIETALPLVAIIGNRGGYIQLSPSHSVEGYIQLPLACLQAALAWATIVEAQPTIARCYWITLSEAVKQLHIHLYPRYGDETEAVGIPLFEARNTQPHPPWTAELKKALNQWAKTYGVCVIEA
jgi:diadenosine tetraphosphate (Ap4A) HIT family hydrolase